MANNKKPATQPGTAPTSKVAATPFLKVRASVTDIRNYPGGQIVRCKPIDDLDGVNKTWAKGSPNGVFELDITSEEKLDKFESGRTYEIAWFETEAVVTAIS